MAGAEAPDTAQRFGLDERSLHQRMVADDVGDDLGQRFGTGRKLGHRPRWELFNRSGPASAHLAVFAARFGAAAALTPRT